MTYARKIVLAVGMLVGLAVIISYLVKDGNLVSLRGSEAPAIKDQKLNTVAQAAGNSKDLGLAVSARSNSLQAQMGAVTEIRAKLRGAVDFKAVFDELQNYNTAEALFFRGLILETCEKTPQNFPGEQPPPSLIPAVLRGDSNAEVRTKYLDFVRSRSPATLCKGFAGHRISDKAGKESIKAAAEMGDIRAIARDLEMRIASQGEKIPVSVSPKDDPSRYADLSFGKRLTEEDFSTIKSALSSKDPTAILTAGPLLSSGYIETALYIGDKNLQVNGVVAEYLWEAIACQYSQGCNREQNNFLKVRCALANQCDAQDIDAYLQKYALSIDDFNLYSRIKPFVENAIRGNDWSAFRIAPSSGVPIGGALPVKPRPLKIG